MDGLVMGNLEFDQAEDCLLLQRDEGAFPVLWPAGTTWRADPPGVVLPNGRIVEPGMTVRGAGGYLQQGDVAEQAGATVADAASRCTGPTGEVAVFNRGAEIVVAEP